MWRRRGPVVAFVNLARLGERNFAGFTEMVLGNCSEPLKTRERFAQTAVGWSLRELGRSNRDRVVGCIEANLERFSRESPRNATRHLPPEVTERLRRDRLPRGTRNRHRR